MPILKQFREQSVAIPNKTAQDPNLSIEALGALTRMTSYSDNYQFKVDWLQTQWKRGRDSVRKILRELRQNGYLKFVAVQRLDKSGTFEGQEWHISTQPIWLDRGPEIQGDGDRTTGLPEDGQPVGRSDGGTVNQEDNKKDLSIKKDLKIKKEDIKVLPSQAKAKKAVDGKPSKAVLRQIPDDFELTPAMKAWAAAAVPDLDIEFETQQFIDRCSAKGTEYVDWVRGWQMQMRNAVQWGHGKKSGSVKPTYSQQSDKADWNSLLPKPRLDYPWIISSQEDAPETYHDYEAYDRTKQEVLRVNKERSDEDYQLTLKEIAEYESSRKFQRRFNDRRTTTISSTDLEHAGDQ